MTEYQMNNLGNNNTVTPPPHQVPAVASSTSNVPAKNRQEMVREYVKLNYAKISK